MVFDSVLKTLNVIKTKGMSVQPRKDHSMAIYGKSMIVFGGQYQNGSLTSDMINFDLEYNDWSRIFYK